MGNLVITVLIVSAISIAACRTPQVSTPSVTTAKETPTPIPLTAEEQALLDQTKGWTMDQMRAEFGGCVKAGASGELCACVVTMVAANLTYPQLEAAARDKKEELGEALRYVFASCEVKLNVGKDDTI